MGDEIEWAREVSEVVLDRLGEHAPPWRVLAVDQDRGPDSLLVTIGRDDRDRAPVRVYLALDVPVDEAVAVTAGQIQDHAIEETSGAALPPCPGHRHPLTATPVDGVASWA
ncbi:MAG TPA: hypothetical protein VNO31_48970, partial [Umezawaea sp.]|nr:hypothetical protein [Umezawaea sp.]